MPDDGKAGGEKQQKTRLDPFGSSSQPVGRTLELLEHHGDGEARKPERPRDLDSGREQVIVMPVKAPQVAVRKNPRYSVHRSDVG